MRGSVEQPKDTANGDFAANHAMASAKTMHMAPRKIAEALIAHMELNGTWFASVEAAGPGFLNFRLSDKWYQDVLTAVDDAGADYGRVDDGHGEKVMVEFVSANPTGPMTIGNARGGETVIPNGAFVPQIGDKLYMIGAKGQLQDMLHSLGHSQQKVRAVSILCGSRTAMYLVWELKKRGIKSQIVEMNHQKCLLLSAELPDTLVIEGDGTDNDLLREEGVFAADAFVSLTDRDEENLLMALSAQRAGVGKVLAKMTRPNYMDLVQDTRIGSIISPKDLVANQITRYVRALANSEGSFVESLYKMMGGQVEALEFTAGPECRELLNKPMKDLPLKQGVLVGAIARDKEIIIPDGNSCIREGDHVVVVTKTTGTDDLMDILR